MKKICQECDSDGKWLPTPVFSLETYLAKFIRPNSGVPNIVGLRKNIAYNLQYLEFQWQILGEFKLTSVLCTQTWKTFIIVGTSIVEALIYFLLRSKGLHTTNQWEEVARTGNDFNLEGYSHRIENTLLRKLDSPAVQDMKLDAMIKKVEHKKLLGSNHEIYKKLNHLRKLRNRVHIHAIDEDYDTDWYKITSDDMASLKVVLYSFMTSSLFNPTASERMYFGYLR